MINSKELCEFLVMAKKATYAAGNRADKIIEADKSTTMTFEAGDWKYHDNYFGGELYGGREVVFFKNEPVYIMVYYGLVAESINDFKAVYKALQGALSLIPDDKPFRGPQHYEQAGLKYLNTFIGEVDNFFGEEIITNQDGKEVYRAKYLGGLIDQRKEN